jgi:hypothetical protein
MPAMLGTGCGLPFVFHTYAGTWPAGDGFRVLEHAGSITTHASVPFLQM